MIMQILLSIICFLTQSVEPTASLPKSVEGLKASDHHMIRGVNTRPLPVAIYYDHHFVCDGSLMSPNWVATNCHCIKSKNPSRYGIVPGINHLKDHSIFPQEITASQIVFNSNGCGSQHETAYIRLQMPLKLLNTKAPTGLLLDQTKIRIANGDGTVCYDTRATCFLDRRYCHFSSIRRQCPATCHACIAPPTKPPPPPCGIPSIPQGYVMGGNESKPGAWPWQAAIFLNHNNGYLFMCGGSLISTYHILTAAKCFMLISHPPDFTVMLGVYNVGLGSEKSRQMRKISAIYRHPKQSRYTMDSDIAIVVLATPVTLNSRVRTICLPAAHENVPVGTKCYITGWGRRGLKNPPYPILQQAFLPIVSQSTCKDLNEKNFPYKITKNMLCIGYGPKNAQTTCQDDNGGPLVCSTGPGGAFKLHGVISWHLSSCQPSKAYSVAAKVSEFRSFIYSKTWL